MENNSSAGGHRESRQHEGCRHPDKALERSEVNIEGFTTNKTCLNKCFKKPFENIGDIICLYTGRSICLS